jgi:hypothetical protein
MIARSTEKNMPMFRFKLSRLTAIAVVCFGLHTSPARAAIVFDFQQVGNDVVVIGAGTVDLAGLAFLTTNLFQTVIVSGDGQFEGGTAGVQSSIYTGVSGPAAFGTGNFSVVATSGSGDPIGVTAFNGRLFLPAQYVSGSPLSNTTTFANQSFASLALTPGTYTYTWGTGGNTDSLTINIPAVPEPVSIGLLGIGAVALLVLRPRRHD